MCFNKIYVQIIHLDFIRFHFLLISFRRVFFLTKEKNTPIFMEVQMELNRLSNSHISRICSWTAYKQEQGPDLVSAL
jgi:hypothetical protein